MYVLCAFSTQPLTFPDVSIITSALALFVFILYLYLTDVLACVKKHWIAVFGMINTDRIASHLVDELSIATKRILASRSGRLRRETTAPSNSAACSASCVIFLLSKSFLI